MTSKNLYSKLMWEDLKNRLWAAALIGLGCFFLFPVLAAFNAGTIDRYETYEKGLEAYSRGMLALVSFENFAVAAGMMAASLICGLSGFSYLNSKPRVDFYHSIPIRREKLYLANYLNGILMMAVPYAVSLMIAVLIGIANGVDGSKLWPMAAAGFGLHMTYFLLMYSTAVIAVMLTGNLIIGILGNMVLTFYLPVIAAILQSYFSSFFETYTHQENGILQYLTRISPVIQYIMRIGDYEQKKAVFPYAMMALGASVLLAVLGCWLYRKRPSEAAGKAMAFAVTRPVIRILITVPAALGFALFFCGMQESMGWAVFGVICGGIICHCVIEIIYHFDFKKLFSHKGQMAACILFSLAVLLVFRYDLTGYDRYLPASGQVKEASVIINSLNDWVSYGYAEQDENGFYSWRWNSGDVLQNMKGLDAEGVLSIAAEGVGQTVRQKQERARERRQIKTVKMEAGTAPDTAAVAIIAGADWNSSGDREETPVYSSYVQVCYTLNSGRQVYRRYHMNLQPVRSQVEKLYGSEAYQKATFPLLTRTADQVADIRYREYGEEIGIDGLSEAQKKEFLETYQQEFAAMTLTKMEEEYPVGLIRFTTNEDRAAMDWWKTQYHNREIEYRNYRIENEFTERDFYPVYPSFTRTRKLLKANGVEVGSYGPELVESFVTVYMDRYMNGEKQFTITDPEIIRELERTALPDGLFYYNPMFRLDDISVQFTYQEEGGDGERHYSRGYFPRGKLPGVLKKQAEEHLKERNR